MKIHYSLFLFLFLNVLLVSASPTTGLLFNGSSASFIDCGSKAQFSPTQFTLEAWVNYQVLNDGYIMSNEGWTTSGQGFTLHTSGSKIEFVIGNTNWIKLQSITNIAINTWYHIAVTYTSNSMVLYINGVRDNSMTITAPMNTSTQNLSIGEGSAWKGRLMTGKMADVRIWNVVRTQPQIAGSMSTPLTGTETGLIADWKMDEGTGLAVADATGINSVSITNALSWFTPTSTGPIRVVCVGNSITAGVGASDNAHAYPAQLANLLGGGYSVLNCGVSARTMLKKGDFPYWNEPLYTAAKNFDPQIVIISLGTNDSKNFNWVFGSQFYSDYASMISEFRSNGKNPHIFVCFPPPAFYYNQYSISDSTLYNSIQPLVDSIRTTLGTSRIDFYHPLLPYGTLFADGIHPSDAGALMMAQIAYKAITTNAAVTSLKSPLSNSTLSSNEQLRITINNNNAVPLLNVPVTYNIDNNTEVTEVIASIPANTEIDYRFLQKVDFSEKKEYSVKVYTTITNQPSFDTIKVKINNFNENADYSMKFAGNNGQVIIPNSSSLMPLNALTLEAWIYPTKFQTYYFNGSIISKEQSSGTIGSGYALNVGGDGQGRFLIGNGNWMEATAPAKSISLNQWSHIAGVYDGSSIKFYVNGVLKATTNNVGTLLASTSSLYIGGSSAFFGRDFIGGIDEVSIWNSALTETEINNNKGYLLNGSEPGLVAYYHLNQIPGVQTVTNSTGNGNNGTIQNLDIYHSWMNGVGLIANNGTGISQTKVMSGVSIYTDPTREFLFIKLDSKDFNLKLVITDLMGRTVLNRDIKDANSEVKINIQNYIKGIYILTLRSDSKCISSKIIL
jgi:acyl-CoA thioesterase-1